MSADEKIYVSYNGIHKLCQQSAPKLLEFKPEVIVAIGGGGFIPARILRTFLKKGSASGSRNIPIYAVGLALYEDMGTGVDAIGKEVQRLQWLSTSTLSEQILNKSVIIIDEVDDSRTTISFCLKELQKDLDHLAAERGVENKTEFAVFVIHNKDKIKRAELPESIMTSRYVAAATTKDDWIAYPWEADDIDEHTKKAVAQGNC